MKDVYEEEEAAIEEAERIAEEELKSTDLQQTIDEATILTLKNLEQRLPCLTDNQLIAVMTNLLNMGNSRIEALSKKDKSTK